MKHIVDWQMNNQEEKPKRERTIKYHMMIPYELVSKGRKSSNEKDKKPSSKRG